MCTDLTDTRGDLRAHCDIRKKGEIYLMTDIWGLQKNVTKEIRFLQGLILKNKTLSEDKNVSQVMLPMNLFYSD